MPCLFRHPTLAIRIEIAGALEVAALTAKFQPNVVAVYRPFSN